MVSFKRITSGLYAVTKPSEPAAAHIRFIRCNQTAWPRCDHWALEYPGGRIDRHESLAEAKNDALKW